MSRPFCLRIAIVAMVGFAAFPAFAQPIADEPPRSDSPAFSARRWSRQMALLGHGNVMGGPYGVLGLSVEYAPHTHLSVGLGAGVGLLGYLQVGGLVRGHLVHGEDWGIVVGAGPSFGRYRPLRPGFIGCDRQINDPPCHSTSEYSTAAWLNVEVGAEYRAQGGFTLRIAPGYSKLLNSGAWKCIEMGSQDHSCNRPDPGLGYDLVYLNIAIGTFLL